MKNSTNLELMTDVFRLFGADIIQRELSFFQIEGVINQTACAQLTTTRHQIIKKLASHANDLLDCLSIPKHALYAPIAADYIQFNAHPNQGEVLGAKM